MNEDMRVASMRVIIGTIYPDVMSRSEEEKHRIYNEVYEHVLDHAIGGKGAYGMSIECVFRSM